MDIFVDSDNKCHATNPDGIYRLVKTHFFDGKCSAFVEGYCYDDGKGLPEIYPWKPYDELEAAQREYERKLLAEYEAALANSISVSELDAAYQEGFREGVDSV